jgi:alkanesulfonate monooxygenase SsuD/methylene tetrahydromethanopterin reductase-like flavin-dependent oxidoreductase (luciferase family)
MLRLVARYADLWNAWSVNSRDTIAPLRAAVDAACREVGRDPATLERTAAVLVDLPGHGTPPTAAWVSHFRSAFSRPATGSLEELAELLRAYAAEGISQVQVVLEPMTAAGIESFAPVLGLLDRTDAVAPAAR